MRTVKEVADLSGISVRTLQYYDEIGLFKPTKVTDAGYRLYDEDALNTLQQILFFKELDFPLKDIKTIMEDPGYNKTEAFQKQKELLKAKRDRLNRLLALLDKLEKGETSFDFKDFDLSEYLSVLEQFKNENAEKIIQHWGSLEAFDLFLDRVRDHEASVAQTAIAYYGSVEKYTAAMKSNLNHFSENMEKMERMKEKGYIEKNKELTKRLVADVTLDVRSPKVQKMVEELLNLMDEQDRPKMDMGEHYWDILIDSYLHNKTVMDGVDRLYGAGASKFMGEALKVYFSKQ